MNGFYYIETFGCQMNERDSAIMEELCGRISYSPAPSLAEADLVILNTCSVRKKAEEKAFSLLGRLRRLKKERPSLMIAVAGCVAQQEGAQLLKRMGHVDLVIGPQEIYRLPELLTEVQERRAPCIATQLSPRFEIPPYVPRPANRIFKSFVTIMQGCNNYCTYCIVPFTRGREISRPQDDILAEVTDLCTKGVCEVTLLGQNVNSYGKKSGQGESRFPQLAEAVSRVAGLRRVRFTTSHPKDLSEDLMRCFRDIDKLCPHLHLPVQSGADRVLKRMSRRYTRADYLEKVALLRQYRPDIVLTTDIIVGFPGESQEDFEETMSLLEAVRFHSAFSFKYSDRPPARSCTLDDKIPEAEKAVRLARLQRRQEQITLERNSEYLGRTLEVMVEGRSKSDGDQWCGRAPGNQVVNFAGRSFHAGQLVDVTVTEACTHSLRALLAEPAAR